MKSLLAAILLFASAADAADTGDVAVPDLLSPSPLGPATTFTPSTSETITFNGKEYPKYVDPNIFGPLLPGQEFGTPPANAFNAASTLSPDGTPWANPSCNFIPCRTEGSDQAQKEADKQRQAGQPRPPAEPPVVVATNKGEQYCSGGECVPMTPQLRERLLAEQKRAEDEAKARAEAENKGFAGNSMFSTPPSGGTPPPPPPAADGLGRGADDRTPPEDVADDFGAGWDSLYASNDGPGSTGAGIGSGQAPGTSASKVRTISVGVIEAGLADGDTPVIDKASLRRTGSLYNSLLQQQGVQDAGVGPDTGAPADPRRLDVRANSAP